MSRSLIAAFVIAGGLIASPVRAQNDLPPDEDVSKVVKEYTFNPVQSKREVVAGNFYFNKGNFSAAAGRFQEATKWDSANAEAWLRLGDAHEKQHDVQAAKAAWEEYLKLLPDAKNAGDVRKRMAKLKG